MPDPTEKKYDDQIRLTLSEHQKGRLAETGNMSKYLRNAARKRRGRYREARTLLDERGWSENELRAACDVLNGTILRYSVDKGQQIAASMKDAARLDATHEKWDISEDRWAELVEAVRQHEPVARALWDVQREFWGPSGHVDF